MSERKCKECGYKFSGRSDKKFCSDQCRVTFNNRINGEQNNLVRTTNNILRRNRRILALLNVSGKTRIARERLLEKGFDFEHFTSLYTNRDGLIYKYCYDQGYLAVDDNSLLLVIKKI